MSNRNFFRIDFHGVWFRLGGYGLTAVWPEDMVTFTPRHRYRWWKLGPILVRPLRKSELTDGRDDA